MSEIPETSPSGEPIHRHKPRNKPSVQPRPEDSKAEVISQHIETHIGRIDTVFHEIVSDLVHIDIHVIRPTQDRPFITLVTSGMSHRPMAAPEGCEGFRFAELLLCLPPDWPLSDEAAKDENNYWPIRCLKTLARLPHEYDTWLSFGHTVPNGDPPEPFADNTKFCCCLLLGPLILPNECAILRIDEETVVVFFSVIPIYEEEMELKLRRGLDCLGKLLARVRVTELIDVKRPNAAFLPWWRRVF